MLILTILLAAFAPLMTKRKSVDLSSGPWRYATNNSDIYYGLADSQTAMIGQNNKASDENAKLIINTNSGIDNDDSRLPSIIFKQKDYKVAELYVTIDDDYDPDLLLGGPFKHSISLGNTAFGIGALYAPGLGGNTAVGSQALHSITGTGAYNTAVGAYALKNNTTGTNNTAIGTSALENNTTGQDNIAIGLNALNALTSQSSNVAIGTNAGLKGIGYQAVAIGFEAMKNTIQSSAPIGIGYQALYSDDTGQYADCQDCIAIGNQTLYNNQSSANNIAIGTWSLHSLTKGAMNVGLGYQTLLNNSSGNYNTAVGRAACERVTGSNKTCLGSGSGPTSEDSTTTNVVYLGSSSTSKIVSGVTAISTYSDKRLKNVKSEYKTGLDAIKEIIPVNYTYKDDKDKTLRVGVIAQDLQKVLPDAVEKNGDGYLVVNQGNLFYTLLNAVKQLDNLVQALINELKVFEIKLDNVIKKQIELEKRLDKLEKHSV